MKKEAEKDAVNRRMENMINGFEMHGVYAGCGDVCDGCKDAGDFKPSNQSGQEYICDSIVSQNKAKIEEMANAHWNYVEKVIMSSITDTAHLYSLAEVMEMRKWDYTSSAIHFYGHGFEDGSNKFAEKTLNRLKEA